MVKQTVSSETYSSRHSSKLEYIDQVLTHLGDDAPLKDFATLFLSSMSTRTLREYSQIDLANFVSNRYRFIEAAFQKGADNHVYSPKDEQVWLNDKIVVECFYPDASHLVITLEAIFQELGFRITRKLHPIIKIDASKGKAQKIKSITVADGKSNCYSAAYFELEEIEDRPLIQTLKDRITTHMIAVQQASQCQNAIAKKIKEVAKEIKTAKVELSEPKEEWLNLLEWLQDLNFSFFGYVAFHLKPSSKQIKPVPGSEIGILDNTYLDIDHDNLLDTLTAHVWRCRKAPVSFMFDTIPVNAPVQRFEHLMRLSLKIPIKGKNESIEHTFLGILKRSSLYSKNIETPIIHRKIKTIFETKNMLPGSYDYNEVIRLFTSIPKYELFRSSVEGLFWVVENLQAITNPNEVYFYARLMSDRRRLRMMVFVPKFLYTRTNIKNIVSYLTENIPSTDHEVIEISNDDKPRLHIYLDLAVEADSWHLDQGKVESDLRQLVKPWEERLRDQLYLDYPGVLGQDLFRRYSKCIPNHYRVRSTTEETVRDIKFMEQVLRDGSVLFNLTDFRYPEAELSGKVSLIHLYSEDKVDLINIMPVLQNMGIYVIDQLTSRFGSTEDTIGFIQSFRVTFGHLKIDTVENSALMEDCMQAVFKGLTENDVLNTLVLKAHLDWRLINVLQTYRNLYLQMRPPFSKEKVNATLLNHPRTTRLLVEYFVTKFSPDAQYGDKSYRESMLLPKITQEFQESLQDVREVAEDVIFKRLLNLMTATVRTNFYIEKAENETFISIKVKSREVDQVPVPAPYREIYVHDVHMEGTHLRFGKVARGGLRWSDRHDDFRTEILGLVKTQQTKNVVIVPEGSKGGFIVKKDTSSREEFLREGESQYQRFISGLLDITDNVDSKGQVTPPKNVVSYDDLDPYLVVAADKGTATFSDIANSISEKYKFWLGDAFASGGSVGYDHKKEGITARGAWECAKLHFKEMGKDIMTEPTTVIGVGDMSGDVFGNGMLLSRQIKLQAAFNHMHVFIDPDPNPELSWEERNRLFHLPRSTWNDYSADLISQGGGVFDRNAKEIYLSPEMKQVLGVADDVLTGEELINAILKMKVEMIWFGGIGTYIKSDNETNIDVGDEANNGIRINASDCKAAVIVEGANLGLTQDARIDYSNSGGRINTDALDNSAGVNMSDYEVNIKILLQQLLLDKAIGTMSERNTVLETATDEVAELCLANNRGQHRLLSMDSIRSKSYFRIFGNLIQSLVENDGLNADSERIPTQTALDALEEASLPMPRPVLSVLQAYVKMKVSRELLDSDILTDAHLEALYRSYFPDSILQSYADHLGGHQLKREIISTLITNQVVNQAGITFAYRVAKLTGREVPEIVVAYCVFDTCLNGSEHRKRILSAAVSEQDKYLALLEFEDLLQMLTQGLLQLNSDPVSFNLIESYHELFDTLKYVLLQMEDRLKPFENRWGMKGFPEDIAREVGAYSLIGTVADLLYVYDEKSHNLELLLQVILMVDEVFELDWLANKITSIELKSNWELAHRDILIQTVHLRKMNLIKYLMEALAKKKVKKLDRKSLLAPFNEHHSNAVDQFFKSLRQVKDGTVNLTTLTVCLSQLNFLEIEDN